MAVMLKLIRNKPPFIAGDLLVSTPAREKELVGYGLAVIQQDNTTTRLKGPPPPASK